MFDPHKKMVKIGYFEISTGGKVNTETGESVTVRPLPTRLKNFLDRFSLTFFFCELLNGNI